MISPLSLLSSVSVSPTQNVIPFSTWESGASDMASSCINCRGQKKAGDTNDVDTLTRLGSVSGSTSALPGSEAADEDLTARRISAEH